MAGHSKKLSFLIQETIDIEAFLVRIKEESRFQVKIETHYEKIPIRLRGRSALQTTVVVRGEDSKDCVARIEECLDDYLEANGLFM